MPAGGGEHQWWQLFQSQPYPAYVTLVHPKITGISLKKAQSRMSELALDDVLDAAADPTDWQPRTFVLKRGTVVLTLPEDADKEKSTFVSQPWMVRINELWFFAQNPLTEEQESPREPKTEPKSDADKRVIKWEQQQIRNSRISAQHFQLEVTYFYRLADLEQYSAFVSADGTTSKQQAKNSKTFCQALLRLGVVESVTAAEELIRKRSTGTSRASRLLNRIVAFSTHEGKLPPPGTSKQQQQQSDEDEEDSAEDDEQEEGAAAADGPTPLESVMSSCKVMFLPASEGLPYMPAPVAQAAQQRQKKTNKRGALLEEVQQQHRELPPGFFCSLIYIKQTGELLSLEDWASGKAAPGLQQDWAQHSRQQAQELLQQTQIERLAAAGPGAANALADLAAAAAALAEGDADAAAAGEEEEEEEEEDAAAAEDNADYVSISEDAADDDDAVTASEQQPGTPTQEQLQQHSQQAAVLSHKQQRRATPGKRGKPLRAVLQPQRRRLRRATAGAGAAGDSSDMGSDPEPVVLSDGSAPESGAAAAAAGEDEEQQQEEEVAPRVKRRRAAAGLVSSSEDAGSSESDAGSSGSDGSSEGGGGSSGSDGSSEGGGSSESDGRSDEDTGRQAGRGRRKSVQHGRGQRGSRRAANKESSSSSEEEELGSDASAGSSEIEEAAVATPTPRKRAAAGAAGGARAAKSRAKASPAAAERETRSAFKSSKGSVLRSGR